MKKAKPIKGWAIVDTATNRFVEVYPAMTKRQVYCSWKLLGSGEGERLARIEVTEIR